jgi:tetratricopeptide (TPR) repeat protein
MIRFVRQVFLVFVVFSLFVTTLCAQRARVADGEIQVHVTYENNRPVQMQLRCELAAQSGVAFTQMYTDNNGTVRFRVAADGVYYIKVSGPGIEDATSEPIEFDTLEESGHGLQIVYVRVKATPDAAQSSASSTSQQVTSAAALRVPQSASKAFDKGMAAWQKKDYQKAADEFEKAVAAYPEYDSAYNNLGVMYAQLNQTDKAMAAFKRSVELNDKNADADRNLARMYLRQKNFPQAEELLKKCLAVRAPDAATLTMLAIAEIEDNKVDDALRDAQKVHTLPHQGFAVAHYVAGQALEDKHQYQQASAEYETYLKESPNGPDVAQVKSALARLSASGAASAPKMQ